MVPDIFCSIECLMKRFEDGSSTSETVTKAFLDRIHKLNGSLHAYVEVFEQEAIERAKASDQRRSQGQRLGPLDGIPIAIKDMCAIRGRKLSFGSQSWLSRAPQTNHATLVNRLLKQGVVLLGRTHMVEFAFGGWGTNNSMGTPRNPWDMVVHRVPGGSSSGSAVAVAAGMATAAIGSDTGGSVRMPAALNGITGLKTTSGLISLSGCAQLSYTLDTIGPLTRNANDAAILTQSLSGYDKNDIRTWGLPETSIAVRLDASGVRPLKSVRLAIFPPNTYAVDVAPSIWAAIHEAKSVLMGLGAQIDLYNSPLNFSELFDVSGTLMTAESYEIHENTIFNDTLGISRETAERIQQGIKIASVDYIKAIKQYNQAKTVWNNWMQEQELDAVIMPCTPVTAVAIEDVDTAGYPLGVLTRQGNVVGGCGLALPIGFDNHGLPIGMQLHGKAFDESKLLSIGMHYQQVTEWHAMHPVIA